MSNNKNSQLLKVHIQGAVQGVGFRPFVYKLAQKLRLNGWVLNSSRGVLIEAEGPTDMLNQFLLALQTQKPVHAIFYSIDHFIVDPVGYDDFQIRTSENAAETTAWILPDIAVCDQCLQEIFSPHNRRYLYPFTNCTHCGPRYSIIEALPYDRCNTTMKNFKMCAGCQSEYDDPMDRRFHAQPTACSQCGPFITLWNSHGDTIAHRHQAILDTVEAIHHGSVVAIKGLGGFHLVVDAGNDDAVKRLRESKHRDEKPFAVMMRNDQAIHSICEQSQFENRWLKSPEAPIVLLKYTRLRSEAVRISHLIAPDNPCLGVMLPYTPLHHILLSLLNCAIVATSGNLSDEPICINNEEALQRLYGIADFFLVHDRPIARPVDDSVGCIVAGRELLLRRARGYAPLPVQIPSLDVPALAVGAHLKNTVTIAHNTHAFVSQHVGDLDNEAAFAVFSKTINDLSSLYNIKPQRIVCDLHPDYMSTKYAEKSAIPVKQVQHHHAHILSCMVENEVEAPALGVAWDGTGYGTDGTIWGGEFLHILKNGFERRAFFRPFPLPGGEAAVREPRRSALGLIYDMLSGDADRSVQGICANDFTPEELKILLKMLKNNINSPWTSSVGRLFDAVASLLDIQKINHYEGQAAMKLEYIATRHTGELTAFPFDLVRENTNGSTTCVIDCQRMISEMLEQKVSGAEVSCLAGRFHVTLAHIIAAVADIVGEKTIVLSGGCFQNKLLTEMAIHCLQDKDYRVVWHQRVPPNDGGISLGQIQALAITTTKSQSTGTKSSRIHSM